MNFNPEVPCGGERFRPAGEIEGVRVPLLSHRHQSQKGFAMLSNMLIGSIKFDDVPFTIGGKAVAPCSGRAWIDSSGTVCEIDFDTMELDGYGEQRAIVEWDLTHFPPLSGTLDDRNALEIARTIAADYHDQIKDLMAEQPARRQRDPGPSMEQRL